MSVGHDPVPLAPAEVGHACLGLGEAAHLLPAHVRFVGDVDVPVALARLDSEVVFNVDLQRPVQRLLVLFAQYAYDLARQVLVPGRLER